MRRHLLLILMFATLASCALAQSKREEGIELYRAGRYGEAVNLLKDVVAGDKKDPLSWIYLGASLYRDGKMKDAAVALGKGYSQGKRLSEDFDSNLEIVSKPPVKYTNSARDNNVTGTVRIAGEFLADGVIGFVVPVKPLSNGLTINSLIAAQSIKFKPAQKNGKPVTIVRVVEYSFNIF